MVVARTAIAAFLLLVNIGVASAQCSFPTVPNGNISPQCDTSDTGVCTITCSAGFQPSSFDLVCGSGNWRARNTGGSTSCSEIDGCASNPCNLAVSTCNDITAPSTGYNCQCLAGYGGTPGADGNGCAMTSVLVVDGDIVLQTGAGRDVRFVQGNNQQTVGSVSDIYNEFSVVMNNINVSANTQASALSSAVSTFSSFSSAISAFGSPTALPSLSTQVAALAAQTPTVTTLSGATVALQNSLQTVSTTVAELSSPVAALQSGLTSANAAITTNTNSINTLDNNVNNINSMVGVQSTAIVGLQASTGQQAAVAVLLSAAINTVVGNLANTNTNLAATSNNVNTLQVQLTNLSASHLTLSVSHNLTSSQVGILTAALNSESQRATSAEVALTQNLQTAVSRSVAADASLSVIITNDRASNNDEFSRVRMSVSSIVCASPTDVTSSNTAQTSTLSGLIVATQQSVAVADSTAHAAILSGLATPTTQCISSSVGNTNSILGTVASTAAATLNGCNNAAVLSAISSAQILIMAGLASNCVVAGGSWINNACVLDVGLAASSPASSCMFLKLSGRPYGQYSGAFFVRYPDGTTANIYCDQQAYGGGWELIMKMTAGTVFAYDSAYWTSNTNTLNPGQFLNPSFGNNAKYYGYNTGQYNQILARFNAGGYQFDWPITSFNVASIMSTMTPFQWFTQTGVLLATGTGNAYFTNAGGRFSSQSGFQQFGVNWCCSAASCVRWGFAWNNEPDCTSNDISSGIGLTSSFGSYSCGDRIGCCPQNTGFNGAFDVNLFARRNPT